MISKKPDDNLSFLYRAILMLQTEEECDIVYCAGLEFLLI